MPVITDRSTKIHVAAVRMAYGSQRCLRCNNEVPGGPWYPGTSVAIAATGRVFESEDGVPCRREFGPRPKVKLLDGEAPEHFVVAPHVMPAEPKPINWRWLVKIFGAWSVAIFAVALWIAGRAQ